MADSELAPAASRDPIKGHSMKLQGFSPLSTQAQRVTSFLGNQQDDMDCSSQIAANLSVPTSS